MPTATAFQQRRRIETNAFVAETDGTVDDLYIDAEITQPKEKSLKATVSVWNIKRDHWKTLELGDPFRVGLGYFGDPFETVIYGTVEEKSPPERDGNGTKYSFSGPDEAAKLLATNSWSHTWQSPAVGQVVRDIAVEAGVGIEKIDDSGATIERRYPISKKHQLAHWLDELKREANELTSTQHTWYCRAGRLSFVPKDETRQQAVALRDGTEGNVTKIDAAEGKDTKTGGADNLEIEMLLDPRVRKDGLARVETAKYWGAYKFDEYTMKSSTDSGDHTVSATLIPSSAEYKKLKPSRQRKLLSRSG